jgi:hypothetical protein
MLRIPTDKLDLRDWVREIVDECMSSSEDRGLIYTRAAQYYYTGSYDERAAIYNKCKSFIDKLAGFLMQPTDVRFSIIFDSSEPEDVLERAQLFSEKLTADFRQSDSDIVFAEAVVWALVNGCHILKVLPDGETGGFKCAPVHPQNFGVLSESILNIDEQEVLCHVSYPTKSRLRSELEAEGHPHVKDIMAQIESAREHERDEEEPTYLHQMVVGGLNPLGNEAGATPEAGGIVQVFPLPSPWRSRKKFAQSLKLCELWIRDRDAQSAGDYTTMKLIYPDIIIEGEDTRRNIGRIPGKCPFVKVQGQPTPGYFWGRSLIADVQMLQDILNKRLRDIKVMWDRNANAPLVLSGFTGVTEEMYYKIVSEGGFINDPNPNAKTSPLTQPPPEHYLEEIDFIWKMFDEASGFSPVMSGQGEPGVRAGVHAQTLVRTSSPRLIDQAARIERQLAETGYLSMRIMQAMDPSIYETDKGTQFYLHQLPGNFQVQVDSHSASPAFAEDNRQVSIALARAGAIDGEDLIRMLHPPGSELLLARLRDRQKAQAKAAQEQKQEEMIRDVIGLSQHKQAGGGMKRRK